MSSFTSGSQPEGRPKTHLECLTGVLSGDILHQDSSDTIFQGKSRQTSGGAPVSTTSFPPLELVFSSPLRLEQKSAPVKKPANEKKWRWKKPKDRPKRPLSAYNIFFRNERQSMMDIKMQGYADPTDKTLGFAGLAKHVSTKWKILDQPTKSTFEKLAAVEKQKYFVSLDIWKKDKDNKNTSVVAEKNKTLDASSKAPKVMLKKSPLRRRQDHASTSSPSQIANYVDTNYAAPSTIQHQQNMLMAQIVWSQQMTMPIALEHQYTMAAAMQEQVVMMGIQNPYLGSYPRRMSMPMGRMELPNRPEPIVPRTQRSMSMPVCTVTHKWPSEESGDENAELKGEEELIQVDTMTDLPTFTNRRMSMPMTGTEPSIDPAVKLSRRSASMPLVNMDYLNSKANSSAVAGQKFFNSPELNSGYSSTVGMDHPLNADWGSSSHPDGVIISRRLSMPVVTGGNSKGTVTVQRRSSSMPMVNMDYLQTSSNITHKNGRAGCSESDELSTNLQEMSAHDDDCIHDGVIYSRRMSMPAVMPTPNMAQLKPSVTVSRRSMSMPLVNTEYVYNEQMQSFHEGNSEHDELAGANDTNMEDEFDDLLSQLRGSD